MLESTRIVDPEPVRHSEDVMHRRMASPRVRLIRLGFVLLAGVAGGCAVRFSQRSPWDIQRIQALSNQLEQFKT